MVAIILPGVAVGLNQDVTLGQNLSGSEVVTD